MRGSSVLEFYRSKVHGGVLNGETHHYWHWQKLALLFQGAPLEP